MRFLHIALIIAMLLLGKGMVFFQHYCGGNLISFDIFHKYSEPCCEGMDEPCDACEDLEIIISLDDFHYQQVDFLFPTIVPSELVQHTFFEKYQLILIEEQIFTPSESPPGRSGRNISILHQSFLI